MGEVVGALSNGIRKGKECEVAGRVGEGLAWQAKREGVSLVLHKLCLAISVVRYRTKL